MPTPPLSFRILDYRLPTVSFATDDLSLAATVPALADARVRGEGLLAAAARIRRAAGGTADGSAAARPAAARAGAPEAGAELPAVAQGRQGVEIRVR